MRASDAFRAGESSTPGTLEHFAHNYALGCVQALMQQYPELLEGSDSYLIAYLMNYDMGLLSCIDISGRTDVVEDTRKYVNRSVVFLDGQIRTGMGRWRVVQAMTDDRYLVQRDTYFGKIIQADDIMSVTRAE